MGVDRGPEVSDTPPQGSSEAGVSGKRHTPGLGGAEEGVGHVALRGRDFADHDDATRVRIVIEHLDHIEVRRAVDGVAADAHARGLSDVFRCELEHRFVGQGSGA